MTHQIGGPGSVLLPCARDQQPATPLAARRPYRRADSSRAHDVQRATPLAPCCPYRRADFSCARDQQRATPLAPCCPYRCADFSCARDQQRATPLAPCCPYRRAVPSCARCLHDESSPGRPWPSPESPVFFFFLARRCAERTPVRRALPLPAPWPPPKRG